MNKWLFFIMFFLKLLNADAQSSPEQDQKIDSLKNIINGKDHDTVKINAYLKWDAIIYAFDPELDIEINEKLSKWCDKNSKKENLSLKEKLFYNKKLPVIYNNLCSIYGNLGKYELAIKAIKKAEVFYQKNKDRKGLADCYMNEGLIYDLQSNFEAALSSYYKGLKVRDEIKDQKGKAYALLNISIVYQNQGKHQKALEEQLAALKILKKQKDKFATASAYVNIGISYKHLNEYEKSVNSQQKALAIFEKLNDKMGISSCYNNLGAVTLMIGSLEENNGNSAKAVESFNLAKSYLNKALALKIELQEIHGLTVVYCGMARLNINLNNLKEARENLKNGFEFAQTTGNLNDLKFIYGYLATIDSLEQNYKSAFLNYHLHINYRDSLESDENAELLLQKQIEYDYNKKRIEDSITAAKQEEVQKERFEKQEILLENEKFQSYFLYGGIGVIFIFTFFIYNRLKLTRRQNEIIERQKEMVEEKQREIVDSINYAKRLQDAILVNPAIIESYLKDSFLLYLPKDIVAGDFYFFEVTKTHLFIAAADSTGHGVPGAMVSVVCSNALTRSVKEFALSDTGLILDKTREIVIETFDKSQLEVKDGMDISFLSIEIKNGKLNFDNMQWSGANNSLWYLTNGEMKEIKADKQPIGKTDHPKPFVSHSLPTEISTLFLFTDGFADQFGGDKGKKFKYSNLQKLLLENTNEKPKLISEKLNAAFIEWKGDLEQVDDVCIIGIKI